MQSKSIWQTYRRHSQTYSKCSRQQSKFPVLHSFFQIRVLTNQDLRFAYKSCYFMKKKSLMGNITDQLSELENIFITTLTLIEETKMPSKLHHHFDMLT